MNILDHPALRVFLKLESYFMFGILIQLLISWLLLWFTERKNLIVLGFIPTKTRLLGFLFGFSISAIVISFLYLAISWLTNNYWSINPDFQASDFFSSTWWVFKSVIFEELIFRGALLYILIQKTNEIKACLISAISFGIYHWFSFSVIGNPVLMTYIFFTTGIWGLMFAFAYSRTESLYLPIGLHLGWNLFNIVIFSQGPFENQLFINSNNGQLLTGFTSVGFQLFQVFAVPIIILYYLNRRRQKVKKEIKFGN